MGWCWHKIAREMEMGLGTVHRAAQKSARLR
jgi:hypothetical protein